MKSPKKVIHRSSTGEMSMKEAMSLLLAAKFQGIGVLVAGYYVGTWLEENHPVGFSWYAVTFGVGVILIIHSFVNIISAAMRKRPSNKENDKKTVDLGKKKE